MTLAGLRKTLPVLSLLLSGLALAQYKPPPLTEAQHLTKTADDERSQAAASEARKDPKEADRRYRHAMDLYLQALGIDPELSAAAAGYGAAGNAVRDYPKVVERLTPFHQAQPAEVEVTLPLAVALYKMKRYAEARPLLELVAKENRPEHFVVHYYLGTRALIEGRGEMAVLSFRQYLTLRPEQLAANDPEMYELLGRSYLLLRRPAEARAMYERAQAGRPQSLSCQMGLEAVLELEGKRTEAIAFLEALVRTAPNAPEPRERLGQLLLEQGDTAKAEAVATELLKLRPGASSYLLMGNIRVAQKQFSRAEQDLKKALELAPNAPIVRIGLARAMEGQGRNREAVDLLEAAVRSGVNTVELWAALGSSARRAGYHQRALEAHQVVVDLIPRQSYGYILLGADHFATGQWDTAVQDYEHALEREPGNARARQLLALALTQRARSKLTANQAGAAVSDLRRAFDLDRSPVLARALGAALLSQRSYAEARITLDESVKLPGAGWHEHLLLGYARLGEGDGPGALSAFEQAGKSAGSDPEAAAEVQVGWALALLEKGDFDAAVQRLTSPGRSSAAAQVAQNNLPLALARRSIAKLAKGDVEGATRDVEAAEKLVDRDSDSQRLLRLARALVQLEHGNTSDALAGVRRALAGRNGGVDASTLPQLEAYVYYRQGRLDDARKRLAQAQRTSAARKNKWSIDLLRAIDRRDAELAYEKGNLPKAERALQIAARQDPQNPYLIHNSGCLQYRKGRYDVGVNAWRSVLGRVPEAALNLGIDAQERHEDPRRAVDFFNRYLAARGGRAGTVREWKERLQSIHGLEGVASAGTQGDAP